MGDQDDTAALCLTVIGVILVILCFLGLCLTYFPVCGGGNTEAPDKLSSHYSRRNTCPMSEDLVNVSENLENHSERLSMISEEDKSLRSQVSCPPLFFAELQNKTENMRKIQSLEWPKWKYDTTGY